VKAGVEAGYKSFRKRTAEDLLRDQDGHPHLSKPYLKQLCKEMGLYGTPYLNDQLYLHFKGFQKLECLEEYTGLKCLWLEGNGLAKIENLDANIELRGIYIQQNCLREIENISHLVNLDALNVSNNLISTIKGLENLTKLNTLTITHNKLTTADSLKGLLECPSLAIVDLSHNDIDDDEALKIFAEMKNLRVLNLMGNKLIKRTSNYRKTMIKTCVHLTYLDDRPVFPKERAGAEAFFEIDAQGEQGGRDAERAARQAFVEAEKARERQGIRHLREIHERSRKEAKLGIEGGDPNRTDSEDEAENGSSDSEKENTANPSISNAGGYDEWQFGEKPLEPSGLGRGLGGTPTPSTIPNATTTVPSLADIDLMDTITGPKAADIEMFDSEDEYEAEDVPTKQTQPLITEVATKRIKPALITEVATKMKIEEVASDAEDEDEAEEEEDIPEEINVGANRNKKVWFGVDDKSSHDKSGADEVPSLERVNLETGDVISTITSSSPTPKGATATKSKPMIEMLGGDDADGMD